MIVKAPASKLPAARIKEEPKDESIPTALLVFILAEIVDDVLPAFMPAQHAIEHGLDKNLLPDSDKIEAIERSTESLESCAHPSKAARDPVAMAEMMQALASRFVQDFGAPSIGLVLESCNGRATRTR